MVQLAPEAAAAMRAGTPRSAQLTEVTSAAGAELTPVADANDPALSSFFYTDVPQDRAEAVATRLRGCSAVAAAYVKPPEGLP